MTFLIVDSLPGFFFGIMYSFNPIHVILIYVNATFQLDCKFLEDSNFFLYLLNTVPSPVLNM